MWKYVTRRIRDSIERSANHFDRRSTTVVNNAAPNYRDDETNKCPPCKWFLFRKCYKSRYNDNDTNDKKWNFDHLNRTWMGAITWSGAVVLGWYTSQLIHLRLKQHWRLNEKRVHPIISYLNSNNYFDHVSKIKKLAAELTPTVYLMCNDANQSGNHTSSSSTASTAALDASDDDLGQVLNSIENRLGLAAIENGQYQEGLSLLRSAANRNHAPAMYNLGLCYEIGLGVTINEKMAMELYKSAAALDHPGALYNLGVYYGQGRGGLKSDQDTATRLLRLAAVQGQQNAIDALKSLEISITEPPNTNAMIWGYQDSPYFSCHDSVVPTHTRLFVENVNYIQTY